MAGGYDLRFRVCAVVCNYKGWFRVRLAVTTWGLRFGWWLQPRAQGLIGGYNKGFRANWRLQLGVWVLVGG